MNNYCDKSTLLFFNDPEKQKYILISSLACVQRCCQGLSQPQLSAIPSPPSPSHFTDGFPTWLQTASSPLSQPQNRVPTPKRLPLPTAPDPRSEVLGDLLPGDHGVVGAVQKARELFRTHQLHKPPGQHSKQNPATRPRRKPC